MLSPLIFFLLTFSLSFSLSLFLFFKTLHKTGRTNPTNNVINPSLSKLIDESNKSHQNNPTHITHSLLDILPSGSSKWKTLFENDPDNESGSGLDECRKVKKKKRRGKKKRVDLKSEEENCENCKDNENEKSFEEGEKIGCVLDSGRLKPELICLYPFTSTSSATQRKIKQQYDQLVKCNESKGLTLAQVGEFANCLIEARHELQQKSEVIKRKFTIKKALLFKADRSSIDRVRQQIYKLELEQKRLEEDAFVYNWLQQQLKLSPAYKKMLELSASIESEAKPDDPLESNDDESAEISFEELLAQEKKDAFWQKNGKSRTCSS